MVIRNGSPKDITGQNLNSANQESPSLLTVDPYVALCLRRNRGGGGGEGGRENGRKTKC